VLSSDVYAVSTAASNRAEPFVLRSSYIGAGGKKNEGNKDSEGKGLAGHVNLNGEGNPQRVHLRFSGKMLLS
jgi:hypothetical protein